MRVRRDRDDPGISDPEARRDKDNLSAHDAGYVALAEALDFPLVTWDARLGSLAGQVVRVEVRQGPAWEDRGVYGYQPQPPAAPPVGLGPVPPPPREAMRRPVRVEPVPGTPYGLAIYDAPAAVAGQAIGALLAGIAAILVSLVVACAGLGAAAAASESQPAEWGPLMGGAFAVLAGFLGLAGIGLGIVGIRRTRPGLRAAGQRIGGRGLAIAGLSCGAVGLTIAACSLGFAVLAATS